MSQPTINPYALLGSQHTVGLNNVVTAVGAGPTNFQNINNAVVTYIEGTYYFGVAPGQILSNELNSILAHAVNSYVNPVKNNFNGIQMQVSNLLLKTLLCKVPALSIGNFILDVEDNITKSNLSVEEQAPLLMATAVGSANFNYFLTAIKTPGSVWYSNGYFDANAYINYANLPYWVQAAMQATLNIASQAKSYGLIDPPPVAGVDLVTAATASIGVACSKVMLQIIPRIQSMGGGMVYPGGC